MMQDQPKASGRQPRSIALASDLHKGRKRSKSHFSGSLDDLVSNTAVEAPVFHILMMHRDKILQLINRGVQAQIIHDACVNQGLFKTSYIHFCRELRKFRLLHGYTVKGQPSPSEQDIVKSLTAKYGFLYDLDVLKKKPTETPTIPSRRRVTFQDLEAPTIEEMAKEAI